MAAPVAAMLAALAEPAGTALPITCASTAEVPMTRPDTTAERVVPSERDDTASPARSLPPEERREGRPRVIIATVMTYQAVPHQTDLDPCSGAMGGVDFCNPPFRIVANNGLPLGTCVSIRGTEYVVADRMNSRYGLTYFDILTQGENYTLHDEPVTVLDRLAEGPMQSPALPN